MLISKRAREALVRKLADAAAEDVTTRPTFAEQQRDSEPARLKRRAVVQLPREQREKGVPTVPVPLELCFQGAPTTEADLANSAHRTASTRRTRGARGGRAYRGCRAGRRVRRGRFAGDGATPPSGTFDIFFANITAWSKTNGDFVLNLRADAVLLAEVHLKRERTHELLAEAGRMGWNTTIGPARQSANSATGSNAGVAACIHGRWQDFAWPDCTDHRGRIGPYSDLVGRSVRLNGFDLQIMSAYFDCHDGVLGRSLLLTRESGVSHGRRQRSLRPRR